MYKKKLNFILFIVLFAVNQLFAQTPKIDLSLRDATLKEFIDAVEQKTDYTFMLDNSIDQSQRISVQVRQETIYALLQKVLTGKGLTFEIANRQILLKVRPATNSNRTTKRITGTVVDLAGEPIIGANIREKGTTNGTVADADGSFALTVTEDAVLQVSYIGYITQELNVGNRTTLQITLVEDTQTLEEVVVIGYGVMRKRDLTGAISTVKSSDINLTGVSSVGHALAGKAAGMYVRQNSAQPGGGLDILIRGAGSINAGNDPLYVVDGFPIAVLDQPGSGDGKMDAGTQGILNFLNPNDIESIEVLKDASTTAIYGARAANGVVLITTKRGKEGKAKISYSTNFSYQKYADTYDLLSLNEWMTEKNKSSWEQWIFDNRVYPWGSKTLEEAIKSPVNGLGYTLPYTDTEIAEAGEGTDWLGLITRDGKVQEHNLTVEGGSKETNYRVSFNHYNQDGIVRNSGFKRYTLRSNFDQKVWDIFKVGLNLTLSRLNNENTQLGDQPWENSGIIRSAVQMGPHVQAYDTETNTYPVNPLLGAQPNPFSLLNNIDHGYTDRVLGNVFIEVTPVDGLRLRVNAGIDRATMDRKLYQPKTTLNGFNRQGIAKIVSNDNNQYLLDATANYMKTFKDIHHVNLLLGASYEQFNSDNVSSGNNNFLTDGFIYNNLGAGAGSKIVGSGSSENKMLSYFLRGNYILKNRYHLTATFRADGASIFAKNNKWGYFPSVAAAWTLSEEEFMQSATNWLSMFKIRASWGQTGNSNIGGNAFATYYAGEAYNREDKSKQIGVFMGRLENPDLKWETTTEYNLGLDVSVLNNRIFFTAEFYHKVISDLLATKPLNTYHEISSVVANIGKTQSTGFEVTLNTNNISTLDFSWHTNITFTTYKDKWKERAPDWKPSVYEKYNAPLRPIYSRRASHIMQIGDETPESQPLSMPGSIVIKDINGYTRDDNGDPAVDENGRFLLTGKPDGIIDDADTELLGTADPGWMAGMTNQLKYKDFDFSFSFNGMFDRMMADPTKSAYGVSGDGIARYGYNALRSVKDRWTWDNPSTTHPSSFTGWNTNYTSGDFFYEKAWFIRMQNITLGYTLPGNLLNKTKVISKLRIFASTNNLFVITPYGGLDPETDYYTAAYPNARTFSFGLDISF
ncbi:MAG: TonB-dependent receptor [Tannerellaceae bacterium]|jgi:TonB-linked SusC/RagA family outer membrane protein|nr:TonB-dependent receptor [Tannerellaceae bacterium]